METLIVVIWILGAAGGVSFTIAGFWIALTANSLQESLLGFILAGIAALILVISLSGLYFNLYLPERNAKEGNEEGNNAKHKLTT